MATPDNQSLISICVFNIVSLITPKALKRIIQDRYLDTLRGFISILSIQYEILKVNTQLGKTRRRRNITSFLTVIKKDKQKKKNFITKTAH